MSVSRVRSLLAVSLWAGLLVGACSPAGDDGLTVFAAASLRSVVEELERAWLETNPDTPLTVATDASNVLAAQIAEGAAADVFLSADVERPHELAEAGLTTAEPVVFATNRVTLVVPAASELIDGPMDLATPGVRLVGSNEGVPIARYTAEAIEALARTSGDPTAFAGAVQANIVSREDNVRSALAKVELGEGDAAFVYVTDALGSEETREVPLPPEAAIDAEYAAVQVTDRESAAEFIEWLGGPAAAEVITAAGFRATP